MFDGLPVFAVESLKNAEKLLEEALEEENEDHKNFLREKAEDEFDWAAFGGVSREYIDVIRRHYVV
ncbi:hypothetical protein SAMN04487864_10511 [Succiniclasticum ruminis]|uniref:Uncharacterized protein n=1 Tax=Succiniclasticum ruminis TaxID=40841 RepID=A0A1G6KN95_9FIRM|nr:hypothetical protein [Succiniclasticum ruminis]SDC32454.1 hypothetical protein SAMN04487864_10511 [Succiniclasticum ruminis]